MTLYLTEADVAGLVGMDDAIGALEGAFLQWGRAGTTNLPRRRLALPDRAVNIMAAALPEADVYGHKVYSRGSFLFSLYSISERRLLAIIQANHLGALRTGAASGVATRLLARAGAASVGLIGCGKQGWTQVEAVSRVRDIKQVAVYSRTPQTRDEFAARMGDGLGLPVSAAATAEACVRDKDIVIAATNSAAPVVFAEWLAPGAHVNAVGANAYTRREVDDQTVLGAAIVATDDREQAKLEARELVDLVADGRLAWQDVAELGALVQGTGPKREDDRQITLFKSLGVALEDVAFARLIYHRALEREIGRDLGDI